MHHFKWRHGIDVELRDRVRHFTTGTWRKETPAVRTEAVRLLDHLDAHHGHLDVTGSTVELRPVSLDRLPSRWRAAATDVIQAWRPPEQPAATG